MTTPVQDAIWAAVDAFRPELRRGAPTAYLSLAGHEWLFRELKPQERFLVIDKSQQDITLPPTALTREGDFDGFVLIIDQVGGQPGIGFVLSPMVGGGVHYQQIVDWRVALINEARESREVPK